MVNELTSRTAVARATRSD